jgi:hypothetical protein
MRGSLRVPSLLGLVVFAGWSLLVNARERLSERRTSAQATTAHARVIPPPQLESDRLRWN